MLTGTLRDMRLGARQMLRQPGFAAVAILSLGLGVGLNTTLFSIVNAVLLRGGHVAAPEQLVEVYTSATADYPQLTTSYPDFLDISRGAPALQAVTAHGFARGILSTGDRPMLVTGETVTANYFDVLGIRIPQGRGFVEAEAATEGSAPVVVLSNSLWQQRFGSRSSIVGKQVTISGLSYTVIGVAPAGYAGTIPGIVTDFWVPLTMVERLVFSGVQWSSDENPGRTRIDRRGSRWLFVKGRLAGGATIEEARAQIETIMSRLATEYPATNSDTTVSVLSAAAIRFHPMLDGYVRAASAGLLAAVGLVLLIACANVANLLLARGAARRRELAIRTAIGASRGTLVRQLVAEGLVLAVAGGGLGLLIAWWAGRALTGVGTEVFPIPVRFEFSIDGTVLAFAMAASIATALIFGLLPALSSSKPDLVPALKDQEGGSGGRARFSMRNALVVGQLALSLMLLATGSLLARGLFAAQRVDLGYDPSAIASLQFNLQMNGYDRDRATAFRDRAVEALRAVPGIVSVSYASRLPLSPDINMTGIVVPGHHAPDEDSQVDLVVIGPGYFDAVGVPLVGGRGFTADDGAQQRRVAVVNETMARTFWPAGNALGSTFHMGGPGSELYAVIGIARDHKVRSVGEEPRPYLHVPAGPSQQVGLIARAAMPAASVLPALRRAVLGLDPTIVFTEDVVAAAVAATTMAPTRIGAMIMGAFGVLALVLAAVGLYGVVSYSVSRRTREVGIRMAVGATRWQVLRLILSQGLRLALVGVGLGTLGAAAAGQLLESMLYGVSAFDPLALGAAAAVLLGVAAAANLVPAGVAARIDPIRALRTE